MKEDRTLQEIKRIKKDIKDGQFMSFYLLYGNEKYLVNDLKQTIIEQFNKNNNINIWTVTEDNYDENKIKEKLSQFGFFNENKMIVFDNLNLFDLKTKYQGLKEILDYNNSNNIIIFIEEKVDKRSKLYKYLSEKDNTEILECDYQKKDVLLKFVNSIVFKCKKKFENDNDALYFLDLVGNDLSNIKNELDKLLDYTEDKYVINKIDIDNIVSVIPEEKIFQMIDMLNDKDFTNALRMYSDLILNNVAIEIILSLLKKNYITLYKIKSMKSENKSFNEMLDNLKVQDWLLKKYINVSAKFSEEELIYKIDLITNIDIKLKTGRLNRDVAFNLLLK